MNRFLRWMQHPLMRLSITALCLLLLFHSMHGKRVFQTLSSVSPFWLGMTVLCTALCVCCGVVVWGLLLRANGQKVSWATLASIYTQGLFWGHIIPGGVAGEAVRLVKTTKLTGEGPALASMAASRLIEALGPLSWGLAAFLVLRHAFAFGAFGFLGVGLLAVAFAAGWFMMFHAGDLGKHLAQGDTWWHKKAAELLEHFVLAVDSYRKRPMLLLVCALLAMLGWGFNMLAMVSIAHAVGVTVNWSVFAFALPLSAATAIAPFALNGMGLREGVAVAILVHFGVHASHAFAIAILMDLQMLPIVAVGALCWLFSK